jgi:hypothetical protein
VTLQRANARETPTRSMKIREISTPRSRSPACLAASNRRCFRCSDDRLESLPLLKRTAVPRPVAGAIVGAVCLTGNLVTTRTTFALGLALGLGALLALISGRLGATSALSVLAALNSSVAGLFLGVAWWLHFSSLGSDEAA